MEQEIESSREEATADDLSDSGMGSERARTALIRMGAVGILSSQIDLGNLITKEFSFQG